MPSSPTPTIMETTETYRTAPTATPVKEYVTENLDALNLKGFVGKASSIKLVEPAGKTPFVTFDFCAIGFHQPTEVNPEGKQWFTATTENYDLLVVLYEGRKLELFGVGNRKTQTSTGKIYYNLRSFKVTFR